MRRTRPSLNALPGLCLALLALVSNPASSGVANAPPAGNGTAASEPGMAEQREARLRKIAADHAATVAHEWQQVTVALVQRKATEPALPAITDLRDLAPDWLAQAPNNWSLQGEALVHTIGLKKPVVFCQQVMKWFVNSGVCRVSRGVATLTIKLPEPRSALPLKSTPAAQGLH